MEQIKLIKLKDTHGDIWNKAMYIYNEAFPNEEKRPENQHIELLINDPSYSFYAVNNENDIIGIIIAWDLDEFVFLDYLATMPNTRNKGYGKKIIQHFQKIISNPIILEVELPDNELAKRRIGFYKRLGFNIIDLDYYMPNFSNLNENISMHLMSSLYPIDADTSKKIMKEIHSKVYGL